MDRLEAAVRARGLTVFARIDHAGGAARADLALRPTELLLFGSPQGGTPLMQAAQSAGIDLPLKALVWEDAAGTVWIGCNDPRQIAARHGIDGLPAIDALRGALVALAATAAGAQAESAVPPPL